MKLKLTIPWVSGVFVGLLALLLLGCNTNQTPTGADQEQAPVTVRATSTRPRATSAAIATPSPTAALEDGPTLLTFWTVEAVSSETEGQAGDFFRTFIQTFDRSQTDIEVELLLKKASGKGGVLDFLRTAREVAPSVLPDVAVINATDLSQAYAEGLIQSLDGRLDRSIVQDLLPAARRMGTVEETLVGVPIGLELEHTVYNTGIFTGTPILWSDVLTRETRYLFPAKGINGLVNDVTLSHYFSAGGELIDDEGQPKFDEQILEAVLTFYEEALEKDIIDVSLLEASTTEELWPFYLEGEGGLAQISVSQYLTDRELLSQTFFAPLPLQEENETPASVMHGWVLVLVTDDLDRQVAALQLMETLLSTTNNATWNDLNRSIPSRGTSYQQLAGNEPYWEFLIEQLNTAQPEPRFANYDRVGRIMQQAVEQVLRNEATAEEATATAIDALAQ